MTSEADPERAAVAAFYPSTVGGMTLVQEGQPFELGEAVLICTLRNEINLLDTLFDHHKRLGVRSVVLVDNGSTDGSLEHYRKRDDLNITVYGTDQPYNESAAGIIWVNALLDHFATVCPSFWALVVDADELFVYPGYEAIRIGEIIAYSDGMGFEAVLTPMLEMHADGPVIHPGLELDDLKYFDRSGFRVTGAARFPHVQMFGGPRDRLVKKNEFSQKKVAFFKVVRDVRLAMSTHALTGKLQLASFTGALLHLKFSPDFASKVTREREEKLRVRSEHYSIYEKFLESETSFFDPELSEAYEGSEQLVRHRILLVDGAYLERFAGELGGEQTEGFKTARHHARGGNDGKQFWNVLGNLVMLVSATSSEQRD